MQDVRYPLAEADLSKWLRFESAFNPYLQSRNFTLYQFDASYDYATLAFFQALDEIREALLRFCQTNEDRELDDDAFDILRSW